MVEIDLTVGEPDSVEQPTMRLKAVEPDVVPEGRSSEQAAGRTVASIPPPVPPSQPSQGPQQNSRPTPDSIPQARFPEEITSAAKELIAACKAELRQTSDVRRLTMLNQQVGLLYEMPLGDPNHAAEYFMAAVEHDPTHMTAIQGARRARLARRDYSGAVELFDPEIRLVADPRDKASLLLEKGLLLQDRLDRADEARDALRQAAELDRANPTILHVMATRYSDDQQPRELELCLERAANVITADPIHRATLISERAGIVERDLNGSDRAIELYETAVRLSPTASVALPALTRLHHMSRRWRDLIRVQEIEVELTEDPGDKSLLLYRIAQLHRERLGNHSDAQAALHRAAELNPGDHDILAELALVHERSGRFDLMANTLEQLVRVERSPRARLDQLHRLGGLYRHNLNNSRTAVHWYESALAIDPLHGPTLRALESLYLADDNLDAVILIRRAEAETAESGSVRAAAYARIGELYEQLKKPDDAITAHNRALAADPTFSTSFKALSRLLRGADRHRDLVDLYERAFKSAPLTSQKIAHLYDIGAIYEGALNAPSSAITAYERILETTPTDLRAIGSLQRAAESAGRFDLLLKALDSELSLTESVERRVALIRRTGEVYERQLQDPHQAIERYRRVLAEQPDYAPALADLTRLYEAAGRWNELLDTLKRELELASSTETRIALRHKMGDLCRHQLGREDQALVHYRAAFDFDATHHPSLDALLRGLENRQHWAEMVDVLDLNAQALPPGIGQARVAHRSGELREEHLNDAPGAQAAYERALHALPSFRPAQSALARLRASEGEYAALARGLAEAVAQSQETRVAINTLLREGEVWEHHLGDPHKAITSYAKILKLQPGHLGALIALERLFRRTKKWRELCDVYTAQGQAFEDTRAQIAAHHAEARVRDAHKIGSPEDRMSVHAAILTLDPEDSTSLRAMELLAYAEGNPRRIAGLERLAVNATQSRGSKVIHSVRLGLVYEASGHEGALEAYRDALRLDPQNLSATRGLSRVARRGTDPRLFVEAATQEATVATDPVVASEFWVRAAKVRRDEFGDEDGATNDLERALLLAPDNQEAESLVSAILRSRSEFTRLERILTKAATAASPERSAALWLKTAHLHAEALADRVKAIAVLERQLRTLPNHVPTLTRQAEYYAEEREWNEAVSLYRRVVQLAPKGDALRDTHLSLAKIWDAELGDAARALVSLQAVLSIEPANVVALGRLADIEEREGNTTAAAEAAKRLLLAAVQSSAERASALIRLARLQRAQGLDAAASEALLEAVMLEGPGSEAALECKALLKGGAAWSNYLSALKNHLERLPAGNQRTPTFLEMGRVLFDQLEQRQRAIEVLEAGAQETEDPAVTRELGLRLRSNGEHERAVDVLRNLATANPLRTEAWRELASTYEQAGLNVQARIATEPIQVLGRLLEQDSIRLEGAVAQPLTAREGSLGADMLERLGSPTPAQAAASELLRVLAPAMTKLYPPDFDSYGLSTRDKLSHGRNPHPFRELAAEVGARFGVESFEVYVHDVRSRGLSVELSSPPSIILPAPVLSLPRSQQVFLLARPLVHIARGFPAVVKLTPRELEVLLASAARNVQAEYGAGLTGEDVLDEQAKRLYKALPRRSRKALEVAARNYVDSPRVDFARWVRGAKRTAARSGALIADDLNGTIDVLRRTERELSELKGERLVRDSDVVQDLVVFWASKAAMHLRRHIGMLS